MGKAQVESRAHNMLSEGKGRVASEMGTRELGWVQ
jgi:hypothetical protein